MIRPLLSLERLSLDKEEGKVCYRYGKGAGEMETMDYLEFIARATSLILPEKDNGFLFNCLMTHWLTIKRT
jgi:hypothetical protein